MMKHKNVPLLLVVNWNTAFSMYEMIEDWLNVCYSL